MFFGNWVNLNEFQYSPGYIGLIFHIEQIILILAIITRLVTIGSFESFTQVGQLELPSAIFSVITEGLHLRQFIDVVLLHLGWHFSFVDQNEVQFIVGLVKVKDAVSKPTISTSPSRLLVVVLNRFRHLVMDDESTVLLIYSHPESHRRHDYLHLTDHPVFMHLVTLCLWHTSMVMFSTDILLT